MSLDVANSVARQALITSQQELALTGRNIAAAGDPNRSRVTAQRVTTIDGGVRIAEVRRAEDAALYGRMIRATSATATDDAILTHLTVLADTVGDPENGGSPAALIGKLETAVAEYANAPDDPIFGRAVIEAARDVANAFNGAVTSMIAIREEADRKIAEGVDRVNSLLAEFEAVNNAVVKATVTGGDATSFLDRRDAIVASVSVELGVTTLLRSNGDMALFTDGGITLFDKTARAVGFERTAVYTATTAGSAITVDGLSISGPAAPMPSRSGAIVGHAAIRDTIVPTYKLQLDEMARVLETTFADGPGSLFVTAGAPDYAGTIAVAAAVDPTQGGTVENLRDGTGNPAGYAAYADRLLQIGRDLSAAVAFNGATELGTPTTIQKFATSSVSWLEGLRQRVSTDADTERAVLARTSEALSSATGVNMDDEYAQQLVIERSFAASSKLIGIIDDMYRTLLEIA
jgi:flagellar hook-associated protein 1 FlgK